MVKEQANLAEAVPLLVEVLESLGYTIAEGHGAKDGKTVPSPFGICALHETSVPIIVSVFSDSIEVQCEWPWTEAATEKPDACAVMVNDMNCLCRLITCQANPECMTMRACFPFAFEPDLFRQFMESWMEDAQDILADVKRHEALLDQEKGFVH
jgi:hypothetical protein